jgi:hypothetical protein
MKNKFYFHKFQNNNNKVFKNIYQRRRLDFDRPFRRYKKYIRYYPRFYKKNDLTYSPRNTSQFLIKQHEKDCLKEVIDSDDENFVYPNLLDNNIEHLHFNE